MKGYMHGTCITWLSKSSAQFKPGGMMGKLEKVFGNLRSAEAWRRASPNCQCSD